MCAAGGGESKVYRPRLPLDPDEVVCGRCKSVIGHDLPLSPINNPFMGHPVFAIPESVILFHILYPYQSMIRKHQLSFCNAAERSLLSFLPILIIGVSFDDGFLRNVEHAAGGRFIDLALAAKFFQYPFLVRQPRQHTRLNGRKVRHEKTASILRDERRADQFRKRTGNGGKERIQQFFIALFTISRASSRSGK